MTIEKVRLLIRGVVKQLPDGSDLRRQLEWADELLSETDSQPGKDNPLVTKFPVDIFRQYKGQFFVAKLLRGWRVELGGKIYPSVSAAAIAISGHSENGWRSWKYIDESTNEEQTIERLRYI